MKKASFILFFFLSTAVFGQLQKQVLFSQLSVDQGLSQNSVVSIAQDSIGLLWFATQDGLNKYDGKEFTHYQKLFEDITKESYSKLGKIYVDRQGSLYIITKEGLLELFDPEKETFRSLNRFPKASTIYQDAYMNTWVGTYGNGLFVYNKKDTIQLFNSTDIIKGIFDISQHNNKVLIATSGDMIEVDPINLTYTKLNSKSLPPEINYSKIAFDKQGGLWIGSYGNGLYYRSNDDDPLNIFSGFNSENSLPNDLNIQSLLFDSKERLWICTYGQGAFLLDFNLQKVSQFRTQQSNPQALHYNDVLCAYEDYTGTIWLGTDGAGLSYYDENLAKFNSMTNASIPNYANVAVARAIAVNSEGAFWIGTSGKGLTYYNPSRNQFRSFKHDPNKPNSMSSDRVMSLLADGDDLWIGFQDEGLAILRNGSFTPYSLNSTLYNSQSTVWSIYKDTKGRYWLGTRDNGLIQFDPNFGQVKQYLNNKNDNNSLSSNNIRVIVEGEKGELWIGTESDGLNRFYTEDERFTRYSEDNIANIKSLYYDHDNIWIGTNGNGLQQFKIEKEEIIGYTVNDGLPNNVIYSILPDEEENLWLSSNRGITKFSKNTTNGISIVNYDTYDGLQALEFNTGASFKDDNGTLYFGGLAGINWFKPSELSSNPIPPRTIISKLDVFDEAMPLKEGLVFKHDENTLSFSFAGLHFSQPERNRYKYKLSNYDPDWSKPTTTSSARYTNLPPGEYNFNVLSSNYDGVWDTSPATYKFTIKPPWYKTIWARLAYVLGILVLLYLIYQYLKWRWQMQVKLQFEHQETERLKKLDELKSKLYTNISHEFRTPLTLISGPIQQLISSSSISDNDKNALDLIESSSQRMLRLVNQLLDLSKLEAGAVQLEVGNYDLVAQLTQIKEVFDHKAAEKGIKVKLNTDTFNETWYDKDIMDKILFNLLSNAIKYSPENSIIQINAMRAHENVAIEVENENNTLTEAEISKLFNRFYQADKSSDGIGVGLSLIKELATLSNGKAEAFKISPETVSFLVSVPVVKSKYNANTIIQKSPDQDFTESNSLEIENPNGEEIPLLLIVEDNQEIRRYITSLFINSFTVLEAKDGSEGINIAIEQIPDLIISDILMPKKDGIELCDTLKQDTRTCHIPIILVTAKDDSFSELSGLRSKADDYITKPFNGEIMKQKVINFITSRRELQRRYVQDAVLRPKDIAVADLDEEFLEEVQALIDTRFMQPDFSSEDFAKEINLSRMQLHRKLKALTGLSTTEFIRSQRLKTAQKLLETSALTISEIAYTVGFNSPSYFTKCFKEAYNKNPSDFSRTQRET